MKSVFSRLFFFIFLLTFFQNLSGQSSCLPSNSCSNAPKICLDEFSYFIDATNGNSNSSATTPNCFGSKEKKYQQFFAFMPTESQLIIQIEVLNPQKGTVLEAAILDNCSSGNPPLSCDTSSIKVSVGQNVKFTPGQTYYLVLAGIAGLKTNYRIHVSPKSAIQPGGPLVPYLSFISGKDIVECPDYLSDYSTNLIECAVTYNWTIESGYAEFVDDLSGNITDIDIANPMTNISITGPKRNNVKVRFLSTGSVKICVQGTNGCQTTSKVCKTITVKRPPDRNLAIYLCAKDSVYINDTLPNGPFYAGYPCRTAEKYDIEKIDQDGCKYNIKLSVTQLCTNNFYNADYCDCHNVRPFSLDTNQVDYCLDNLTTFGKEFIDTLNTSNLNLSRFFILTDYNTSSGISTIIETSKNGIFNYNTSYITGKTYYITSVVGEVLLDGSINYNNPTKCLMTSCQPIRFLDAPSSSVFAAYNKVCGRLAQLNANATNGSGKWTVISKPSKATFQFLPNDTDPKAQFSVSEKGNYILRWVVSNGSCSDTSETILNILDKPTYKNLDIKCNQSGTTYTVNFKIVGTPPYKLLKGSSLGFITGTNFISFPIASGKPYQVFIKDAQNCDTLILKGVHSCTTFGESSITDRENEANIEDFFKYTISPNPTKNDIWVKVSIPISGELYIRNIEGKVMKQIKIQPDQNEVLVQMSDLANGYYTSQIIYKDKIYSNNFIINRN